MSQEKNSHDPVNALAEADATGKTAEIFADIRQVMQIPLVTSIWRTLASVDDGLETVWAATRPLYESGQPDKVLEKLKTQVIFPIADPIPVERLEAAGFQGESRSSILSLLDAYNRSNSLNLITLTALVSDSHGHQSTRSRSAPPISWPTLPTLLAKNEISAANWELLEKIAHIGANNDNPALPTLWRHMIHWPDLLALILEYYLPLHWAGSINRAATHTRRFAQAEATSTAFDPSSVKDIPAAAWAMIRSYVGKPPSVTRMVALGHGVAQWLKNGSDSDSNISTERSINPLPGSEASPQR